MTYGFGELDEIVLAYATIIHKSQGSEYPAVVIPLTTQYYPMLRRNLLYTAVTRGQRLVVIVGQKRRSRSRSRESGHGGRHKATVLAARASLSIFAISNFTRPISGWRRFDQTW